MPSKILRPEYRPDLKKKFKTEHNRAPDNKNPKRPDINQRLTGWDFEEYDAKNKLLTKTISDCLNEQGFDSAFNIPDYILAEHIVASLWQFARSSLNLAFHEERVEIVIPDKKG